MNRRQMLRSSSIALVGLRKLRADVRKLDLEAVKSAPSKVPPESGVIVQREWTGEFCRSRLVNRGKTAARVREVVLFSIAHDLPKETQFYGESFQMLSQTAGTLGNPVDLAYSELRHYKIPQPDGITAASGMITLTPSGQGSLLLAFTSCRRFIGRFYLRDNSIEAVVDTEGLELAPGESWELEEFTFNSGVSRATLLAKLADCIRRNHPPLKSAEPTGWCSWYCFGPRVTAQNVLDNLDAIAKNIPGLKYVQVDDGYQPAMGDWLETGNAFGGDVVGVLKQIRKRRFEPAIWVAPFIAEENSHVFQQHPEWFIRGADGHPLRSSDVTFGGWRRGPWYALDGTHPEAQSHLESIFRTMRNEWGCTYFKLDANFWGAMHGGLFHDPKATRIEAYRRGMQAILRGAGDSFILGCNHPLWPSFGLIHGSRSSGDIKRTWATFRTVARQNLSRNWQNGRLWWNDPDAVVLTGDLPDNEFQFHATSIYASGGMVLSGDDLTKIPANRLTMLRKLLPPTGVAAQFDDESLEVGRMGKMICVFNWDETPRNIAVQLPTKARVTDYWSGEDLGVHQGTLAIKLEPHSARLLKCT
jgi:alpha-galactosidase